MESLSVQLQPFLAWLLRSTIQASALICLILLVQLLLRHKLGARWSHALWLILLVRMVLPWAPQSRASIFNLIPQSVPQIRAERTPAEVPDDTFKSDVPDKGTGQSKQVAATEPVPKEKTPLAEAPAMPQEAPSRLKPALVEVACILPLIWLAGAAVLGIYICANNFSLLRIVRRERPLTDQKILDLLEDCKAEMGIRIVLGIVTTDKVKSASLFGFVRPRLLLPAGMIETLSREELRYVFLHELAHLKRHDIYLGWLMSILQVLHWFNPLVWLAFYRMRADRELACDALVLARTQPDESKDYGRTIVSLIERFSQARRLLAMAGILETKAQLKRRITMIAQFKKNSYRWSALAVIVVIILGCISLPDRIRAKAAEKPLHDAKAGPTLRRVIDCTANAAVSPDARFVCYPKYDDSGELVVHNLVTGKQHIIKASAGAAGHEGDPLSPVFSPDGRTIAYTVADEQEDQKQKAHERSLYLIGADGTNKRVLCRGIIPDVWSSDGKKILGMTIGNKEDPIYIVWVSTEDGSIGNRIEFPTKRYQAISLSPDMRHLAFDRPQAGDPNATWWEGKWDIFVLHLNSGQESPIVRNPAGEVLLGWAPSGKHILFLSDRMGTWDAWLQPVAEGVSAGQAKLVSRNLGHVTPGRFAQNGAYYYQVEYNYSRIYFGEINLQTGQVLSTPKALEGTGFDKCVDWSPDGRRAAFCSFTPDRPGPCVVHIHDLTGGSERKVELDPKLETFRCLRWSPDGKSLLVSSVWNYTLGSEYNKKEGIDSRVYRIDVESGKSTVLMQSERRRVRGAELSRDGKTLFYSSSTIPRGQDLSDANTVISRRDLDTGEEKPIFKFSDRSGWFSWAVSRSGELVAVGLNEQKDSSNTSTKKIMVVPSTGGQIMELVRWEEGPGAIWDVAWTADGKGILFVLQKDIYQDTPMELWHVFIDVSQPRKIMEADLGGWSGVRVHPDGRRIAFDAARRFHELWVLENFLPAEK